jgi:hypothetical protein
MEDASERSPSRASSDTIRELDEHPLFSDPEETFQYTKLSQRKCVKLQEAIPWLLSGLLLFTLILQHWHNESIKCVPVGYWGASDLGQ